MSHTFDEMNAHNRINALNTLLPMVNKIAQPLDDAKSAELKDAFLTVLFYMGSQVQYYDFKDNY